MRPAHYILGPGHIPLPEPDLEIWATWMENDAARRVAQDEPAPGIWVSTVFLGIDHRFIGDGPPILFETMTFSDYGGDDERRYSPGDEAMAGHARVVAELRGGKVQTSQKPVWRCPKCGTRWLDTHTCPRCASVPP